MEKDIRKNTITIFIFGYISISLCRIAFIHNYYDYVSTNLWNGRNKYIGHIIYIEMYDIYINVYGLIIYALIYMWVY